MLYSGQVISTARKVNGDKVIIQEIPVTQEQMFWIGEMLAEPDTSVWSVDHVLQKRYVENVDLKIQIAQDFVDQDFRVIVWE